MKYTDIRNLKVTLHGGPDPHDNGISEDEQIAADAFWENITPEQLAVVQREIRTMAAYQSAHPRPAVAPRANVFEHLGEHAMLLVGTGGLAHAGMVVSAIWKRLTK